MLRGFLYSGFGEADRDRPRLPCDEPGDEPGDESCDEGSYEGAESLDGRESPRRNCV